MFYVPCNLVTRKEIVTNNATISKIFILYFSVRSSRMFCYSGTKGTMKNNYRISSFKRCGVYLILRLLGGAFVRGRRLF